MNSEKSREQQIVKSWYCNAAPWSRAIREASIISRQLVANQAIIDAVAGVASSRILDLWIGKTRRPAQTRAMESA